MRYQRVAVTGSLAFDHIMSMPGKFRDHIMPDKIHVLNVSFIMDSFRKEFGGTAGNVSYALSQLGIPALLFGSVGNDFSSYKDHLNRYTRIDTSGIKAYDTHPTSQGFVMTDQEDNQIWGFFAGAMKEEVNNSIKSLVTNQDLLLIGPNDPKAVMHYVAEAKELGMDYFFDPAFNVPHFSAQELEEAISGCKLLIGNDYEIELIRRQLRWPDNEFFTPDRVVITTMGGQGSHVRLGAAEFQVAVAKVDQLVDPTGAGDAYRAGFITGYVHEKELEVCAQIGAVAASYAVESHGTQVYEYTPETFIQRYHQNFEGELSLG